MYAIVLKREQKMEEMRLFDAFMLNPFAIIYVVHLGGVIVFHRKLRVFKTSHRTPPFPLTH